MEYTLLGVRGRWQLNPLKSSECVDTHSLCNWAILAGAEKQADQITLNATSEGYRCPVPYSGGCNLTQCLIIRKSKKPFNCHFYYDTFIEP